MLFRRFLTFTFTLLLLIVVGSQQGFAKSLPVTSDTVPAAAQNKSRSASANHLAQLATQINGVNSATVVVLGGYVIVGLDLDPKLGRHQTGNIKYAVANALKNDPDGGNAFVTSDPDVIQRLKDINTEIQQGRPMKGILDQLALVVERLMPDASKNFMSSNPNQNSR